MCGGGPRPAAAGVAGWAGCGRDGRWQRCTISRPGLAVPVLGAGWWGGQLSLGAYLGSSSGVAAGRTWLLKARGSRVRGGRSPLGAAGRWEGASLFRRPATNQAWRNADVMVAQMPILLLHAAFTLAPPLSLSANWR